MVEASQTAAERSGAVPAVGIPATAPKPAPPGLEAASKPDWALRFLAQVSARAKDPNALSTWIYPGLDVDYVTGETLWAGNKDRDALLAELCAELVRSGRLAATATKTAHDRWLIYRNCVSTGAPVIEGVSAFRLLEHTLPDARERAQKLFADASHAGVTLQHAAMIVRGEVERQFAGIRDSDLYAISHPKNLRSRDGSMQDRVTRIRYVQAIRTGLGSVRSAAEKAAQPADSSLAMRGLGTTPLNRGTEEPTKSASPDAAKALLRAFDILARVAWHPEIAPLVRALADDLQEGLILFKDLVDQSIKRGWELTGRIGKETLGVWNFSAALRAGIAGLASFSAAEKNALTTFAINLAPSIKGTLDETLELLGNIITLIELFGGPLAPVGLLADVVLSAAKTAVSFLDQLDQDRAESATIFEKEGNRLSTGGHYSGTVVQGIAVILAATASAGTIAKIARRGKQVVAGAFAEAKAGSGKAVGERAEALSKTNTPPASTELGSAIENKMTAKPATGKPPPAKAAAGKARGPAKKNAPKPSTANAGKRSSMLPTKGEIAEERARQEFEQGNIDYTKGDLHLDEHNRADDVRRGLGVPTTTYKVPGVSRFESAHIIPQDLEPYLVKFGYSKGRAKTIQLPESTHGAIDQGWVPKWQKAKESGDLVLAQDIQKWFEDAVDGANDVLAKEYGYKPGVKTDFLSPQFRQALKDRMREEFAELGIKPNDVVLPAKQ
jgi:hypothetical protein